MIVSAPNSFYTTGVFIAGSSVLCMVILELRLRHGANHRKYPPVPAWLSISVGH
jgi:hypothetical protein